MSAPNTTQHTTNDALLTSKTAQAPAPRASNAAAPGARDRISKRTLLMLVALLSSTCIGSFAQGMMNIALPMVSETFHIDLTTANWIVLGYNVMAGTVITMAATLLRKVGLRKLMAAAAASLALGSLLAFFAANFWVLVAGRLLQAVATGIYYPIVSTSIEIVVPKGRQGTIFAVNSGGIGVGQAVGPLTTGFLLTRFGLHVPFLVPAVLGGVLVVLSLTLLHEIEDRVKESIDPLSVGLSFVGLAIFMYGISELTHYLVVALVCLGVGAAILGGFAARQLRLPKPLLNVRTLCYGAFTIGITLIMLGMMASISMSLLLPLFYEGTAGKSAFEAGILIFFPLIVYGGVSVVAGRLFDKHPGLPLTSIGFALILAGFIGIHLVAGARLIWGVFGFSFLVYVGVSFIVPPAKATAMGALPHPLVADGASVNSTLIQVAECFAAALFVGVLSADVVRLTGEGVARAEAYAQGFSSTIWISIALCAASLAVAVGYHLKTRKQAGH